MTTEEFYANYDHAQLARTAAGLAISVSERNRRLVELLADLELVHQMNDRLREERLELQKRVLELGKPLILTVRDDSPKPWTYRLEVTRGDSHPEIRHCAEPIVERDRSVSFTVGQEPIPVVVVLAVEAAP